MFYVGQRTRDGIKVGKTRERGYTSGHLIRCDAGPLNPRDDIRCYDQPTGVPCFDWGANPNGTAAAQLALALIADVTGDKELAESLHLLFMVHVVRKMQSEWALSRDTLLAAIEKIKQLKDKVHAKEASAGS